MTDRIKWIKQSGQEVHTNSHPANIAKANELGWLRVDYEANVTDSRGLPWDGRINTRNKSTDADGNWKYKVGMTAEAASPVESELYNAVSKGL